MDKRTLSFREITRENYNNLTEINNTRLYIVLEEDNTVTLMYGSKKVN